MKKFLSFVLALSISIGGASFSFADSVELTSTDITEALMTPVHMEPGTHETVLENGITVVDEVEVIPTTNMIKSFAENFSILRSGTFTQDVTIKHSRWTYVNGASFARVKTYFDCSISRGETEVKINKIQSPRIYVPGGKYDRINKEITQSIGTEYNPAEATVDFYCETYIPHIDLQFAETVFMEYKVYPDQSVSCSVD